MFIACEELRILAKTCGCRLHDSDDFASIIEEYPSLYYPCHGIPTHKEYILSFSSKKPKRYMAALSGEVTAAIFCCLKVLREVLTDKRNEQKSSIHWMLW